MGFESGALWPQALGQTAGGRPCGLPGPPSLDGCWAGAWAGLGPLLPSEAVGSWPCLVSPLMFKGRVQAELSPVTHFPCARTRSLSRLEALSLPLSPTPSRKGRT